MFNCVCHIFYYGGIYKSKSTYTVTHKFNFTGPLGYHGVFRTLWKRINSNHQEGN